LAKLGKVSQQLAWLVIVSAPSTPWACGGNFATRRRETLRGAGPVDLLCSAATLTPLGMVARPHRSSCSRKHDALASRIMRTTIDIAEDVLLAAKELARREGSSAGAVISRLARQSLIGGNAKPSSPNSTPTAKRLAKLGICALPHRGGVVTNTLIDRLRDEEGV